MKILYLITRAELGGAQVHVADLIHAMKHRAEIAVAAGEPGYLADICERENIPFHRLQNLTQPIQPVRDIRAVAEIRALIRMVQPDLVHVHTSKAGLLGRIAAAFESVPCVFTAHTWSFAEGIGAKRKAVALPCEWLAARLPGRIITVSESNRIHALHYGIGHPGRITTVWNGVADTRHRAIPAAGKTPRLTMVSRFVPQKDHLTLIHAVSRIETPFVLNLIGDGPTRAEMEQEASHLGLSGKVVFQGARRDVDVALAESDVFVLSTNWEGFPLTIIEAMRAGLPVVASDVDGVGEAVADCQTGYLVPRGDVGKLESRLRTLINSFALRSFMGTAGRRRYEAAFTLETMIRRTWSVYQEAIGGVAHTDPRVIPLEGSRS